jgi:hypothetical protein
MCDGQSKAPLIIQSAFVLLTRHRRTRQPLAHQAGALSPSQHLGPHYEGACIAEGLRVTGPLINNILASSGTAGAAAGVLHQGEIIHTTGYGFEILTNDCPGSKLGGSLFSLTKFMTSAAIGSLIYSNSNAASWDSNFASLVPSFATTR